MEGLANLVVGFSVIVAGILFAAYALFIEGVHKSTRSLVTCALLLFGLSQLQLGHAAFFQVGADPLASTGYRLWLFLTPPMFYLFGRSILFDESGLPAMSLLHLLPVILPFAVRVEIAISILFCIGTGYSLWLTHVVYTLASGRRRSRFELFFLALFSFMAIGVLLLGFALPYIDATVFYLFYTYAIGLAFVLVVGALLSFPELLVQIVEVAKAKYTASTLNDVDIAALKATLERLMTGDQLFRQDTLSLATLAEAVGLSSHQLSELINTEYGISFSRYVREHRVEEAKRLLRAEPDASVLSISLEVGFKSQSNFYAAFKELTGQSPSAFRDDAP